MTNHPIIQEALDRALQDFVTCSDEEFYEKVQRYRYACVDIPLHLGETVLDVLVFHGPEIDVGLASNQYIFNDYSQLLVADVSEKYEVVEDEACLLKVA